MSRQEFRKRLEALTAQAPLRFDIQAWYLRASLREWTDTTELLREVPERYHAAALMYWLSDGTQTLE